MFCHSLTAGSVLGVIFGGGLFCSRVCASTGMDSVGNTPVVLPYSLSLLFRRSFVFSRFDLLSFGPAESLLDLHLGKGHCREFWGFGVTPDRFATLNFVQSGWMFFLASYPESGTIF